MKRKRFLYWTMIFCLFLAESIAGCMKSPVLLEESPDMAPRISKEELKVQLDDPFLLILDVRSTTHWVRSATKIKGAIREKFEDLLSWFPRYLKKKTIVFYCA